MKQYSDHRQTAGLTLDNFIQGINDPPFGTHLDLTATKKKQVIAFLKTPTNCTCINGKRFTDH